MKINSMVKNCLRKIFYFLWHVVLLKSSSWKAQTLLSVRKTSERHRWRPDETFSTRRFSSIFIWRSTLIISSSFSTSLPIRLWVFSSHKFDFGARRWYAVTFFLFDLSEGRHFFYHSPLLLHPLESLWRWDLYAVLVFCWHWLCFRGPGYGKISSRASISLSPSRSYDGFRTRCFLSPSLSLIFCLVIAFYFSKQPHYPSCVDFPFKSLFPFFFRLFFPTSFFSHVFSTLLTLSTVGLTRLCVIFI